MYEGRYSEGDAFRTVPVTLAPHGVSIETRPGHHDWWSFEQARIWKYDKGIRFERETAALDVGDPEFLNALEKVNPRVARGQAPETTSEFALRLGLLFVTLMAAAVAILWAGIPLMTLMLAKAVPANVEDSLGTTTIDSIAPPAQRREDAALNAILGRLAKAAPPSRYTFHAYVVDQPVVNAVSAPGGYIVIYRGLLDHLHGDDEVAAVLAHEMQHILRRHGLQALIRSVSFASAFSLITGDPAGALAQSGGTLTTLHHQRGDEASADREGFALLKAAGYHPEAMISMLETLDKLQVGEPALVHYLSTHPATRDRIARLHDLR